MDVKEQEDASEASGAHSVDVDGTRIPTYTHTHKRALDSLRSGGAVRDGGEGDDDAQNGDDDAHSGRSPISLAGGASQPEGAASKRARLGPSKETEQPYQQAGKPLPAFFCPITDDIMRDPVSTADGQTYERAAIESWLERSDTSPATGAQLPSKTLIPNIALRQSIEEWEEAYALHVRRVDIELSPLPLASGSFKTVYQGTLCQHVQGGAPRKVPVAVLKMRRGDCATEAGMFLKLGRHPRLVRFMGQCVDGEEHILLTEFAALRSLSDAFETWEDTVTLDHNLLIMQQVAEGMEHLIANGIVHRDLAARNVLVFSFDPEVIPASACLRLNTSALCCSSAG